MKPFQYRQTGQPRTLEHRLFVEKDGKIVSPWHDIPLFADKDKKVFNMIVEIPRWTNAKLEMSTKEPFNPIKQDVKKGKLRYVKNCFPHHGYIWNYGAFPQTWEDPTDIHPDTKAKGDNDPIDVCEIGEEVGHCGQIKQVKILGVMALLDEGETDWKVIVIDVNDPMAQTLNDIDDVDKHMPGLLRATYEWFKIYKVPDGKPENKFAFNGEAKGKDYATDVVLHTHEAWRRLITGKIPNQCEHYDLSICNLSLNESPGCVKADHPVLLSLPAGETVTFENSAPEGLHRWHYINC